MDTSPTRKPMKVWTFYMHPSDFELLFCAASREGISQAEFVRQSLRERARRIVGEPAPEPKDAA